MARCLVSLRTLACTSRRSARVAPGRLAPALFCAALGTTACGADEPEGNGEPTATAGSGGNTSGSGGSTSGPTGGNAGASGNGNQGCQFTEDADAPTSFTHLIMCTPISYSTNPPSGGNHYLVWAAYQTYDYPVPAGFLVHSLEHGAVIFWYNCPDGCADEVAQAAAMIDALPEDPLCAGLDTPRRAILVPSPDLDARWAASSWGYTTKADCFDAEVLSSFYEAHSGQGREDLCNAGVALTQGVCP